MTQQKKRSKEIRYISPEAVTYGRAIVDLGFTFSDISDIRKIFQQVPELYDVLAAPAVNSNEKRKLIDKVFILKQEKPIQSNFIKLLIDKNRFYLLDEILQAAWDILQTKKSTVTAKLSYVTMPTDEQLAQMEKILIEKLQCQKIQWDFHEDPDLMAGFRLDAGELFFDYSVRGRLDEMKKNITGR